MGMGLRCRSEGSIGIKRDATFSADRKYRYVLDREWETSGKLVTFIMLNPSNADEVVDDRTIKRCIDFAKESGCGRLRVVNLFAYRSTDPKELEHVADPIGDGNDDDIRAAVGRRSWWFARGGMTAPMSTRGSRVSKKCWR